jgi:outer membrane protein
MHLHRIALAGSLLLGFCALLPGKTQTMGLAEALQLAARQNPDILLARLDAQREQEHLQVVRDPFSTKVTVGSDPVYTSGYPDTIYTYPNDTNGHSPSIANARIDRELLNKYDSYQLAAARRQASSAHLIPEQKTDEIAYRVASLYFDAQQSRRKVEALQGRIAALNNALSETGVRVHEQADLPVELLRAKVNLRQSEQLLHTLQSAEADLETQLAVALGLSANDRILPVAQPVNLFLPPVSSDAEATGIAIDNSKELSRLQSTVLAKQWETRSYQSTRLPQASLVAQYSLFEKRNYIDYFPQNKFQPNNAQLGASLALPLLVGSAPGAQSDQAQSDLMKLRIQIDQTRNRIAADTQHSYAQLREAESLLALSRQQLDVAQQDLSVQRSRYEENLGSLSDLRNAEAFATDRLLALYENESSLQKAKLAVLRQLGNLLARLPSSDQSVH